MKQSDPWTSIRVHKSTADLLRAACERAAEHESRVAAADGDCSADAINPQQLAVTMEEMILRLIGQKTRKAERSAASRARRRKQKKEGSA